MKINLRESDWYWPRLFCSLLFLGCSISLFAQFNVQIKLETTSSDDIYLAGNINGWNPSDTTFRFIPTENGLYLEFITDHYEIEFKLTKGTWGTVEKNTLGSDVPNRKHLLKEGNNSIQIYVDQWGNGSVIPESRTPQVKILSDSFYSQHLNTYRRIWIFLPESYNIDTSRAFPVWYMHDGQNLFDNSTAFSGEWKIDETLKNLEDKGSETAIIVGIDNGGIERMNEYSPWLNEKYQSGGKGEAYLDFLTKELKPFVDSSFRTLACRQFTTIGGSSMGGLISLYGLLKYQDIFGNALVFSPAFWFAKPNLESFVRQYPLTQPAKIHFLAGKLEGPEVVKDMDWVRELIAESQILQYDYVVRELGEHNENFWASEFENAFKFLNSTPEALVQVDIDSWMPKSLPCTGTRVTYTISKNMLPFYVEIEGGKILNPNYKTSGQLIIQWEKNSSESLLIIQKEHK